MKIVNFYIDGLNVYWRIKDYLKLTGVNFQWLNYYTLCQSLLKSNEKLGNVYLFTTELRNTCLQAKDRYKNFITAQKEMGVIVQEGYFNKKSNQEKETDLKIGTQLLLDAIYNEFDVAFLMSTDNDFAVTFRAIKKLTQDGKIINKSVGILTPPFDGQYVHLPSHKNLRQSCSTYLCEKSGKSKPLVKNLRFKNLQGYSLPREKRDKSGNIIFTMPSNYQLF